MPVIRLETLINADQKTIFGLSRSIDLHQISTAQTNERVVAGRSSGLIQLGESVTWEARHFGIVQKLTAKITQMQEPEYFVDEMVSGAFKSFRHEHIFEVKGEKTLMIDVFTYVSPLGIIGKLANQIFLQKYMTKLLRQRNKVIKEYAEYNRKDRVNFKGELSFKFREYTIELTNVSEYAEASNENMYSYSRVYSDQDEGYRANSQYGIKVISDEMVVKDCLVRGYAGATGVGDKSALLDGDKLLVCCSDNVFCLSIPDLDLLWRTKVDAITCFEIYQLENDYLIYGEMSIARIDRQGQIKWEFSGADIFVSDGSFNPFELTADKIILFDWSGKRYELNFDGKLN